MNPMQDDAEPKARAFCDHCFFDITYTGVESDGSSF